MNGLQREFTSFLIVGGVATACHYALMILLVEGFGVSVLIASAAGALFGAIVSYRLNRTLTFRSHRKHRIAVPRFFTIAGLSLAANTLFMALFTGPMGLNYVFAQIITTLFLILLTFLGNKFWTFRSNEPT